MTPPVPWRPALVASSLVLPACVTAAVWNDVASSMVVQQAGIGEHRFAAAPAAQLCVPLAALPASWREGHRRQASDQWLVAVPDDGAAAVAQLVGLAGAGRVEQLRSVLFLADDGAATPLRGQLALSARWTDAAPHDFTPVDGLQVDPARGMIALQANCSIAWSAALPTAAVRADGATTTCLVREQAIGELAWRAVVTPVAFTVDVVTLPLQLIFGAVHF